MVTYGNIAGPIGSEKVKIGVGAGISHTVPSKSVKAMIAGVYLFLTPSRIQPRTDISVISTVTGFTG